MKSKERCTTNLNFMTPGAVVLLLRRGHISHNENVRFRLKYPLHQNENIVIMIKEFEGCTKIEKFNNFRGRSPCAGAWPNKPYNGSEIS